MRKLLALLILLATFSASAATANKVFSNSADHYWTAAATCSGGANCGFSADADPTDDFYIIGGTDGSRTDTTVIVQFDPGLTASGGIAITAGKFIIPPGQRITVSRSLVLEGGELIAQGAVVWEGRIKAIARTDADTNTYTLDSTPTGAATTDFFVFLDDEQPNSDGAIIEEQQVGPGNPEPDKFRPNFNRGMWAPIESVAGLPDIAVDMAQKDETFGATNAPYVGTRGQTLSQTASAMTVGPLHQWTAITAGALTDDTRGDYGSHYLEFTASAGTVDECEGKVVKVMEVTNNGATDVVYVRDDVSHCGATATFNLTKGDRVGDRVAIIRPAIIDLNGTGYIAWGGGRLRCEWCVIEQIGFGDTTATVARWDADATGIWRSGLSVGGANGFTAFPIDATTRPDAANSWIRNAMFRYFNEGAVATYGIMFGNRTSAGLERNDTPLSLTGMEFEHVYIADTVDDKAGAYGVHALNTMGVNGFAPYDIRIERQTDDGIFNAKNCRPGRSYVENYGDGNGLDATC